MRLLAKLPLIALGLLLGCSAKRPAPEMPPAVPAEELKALAEGNRAFALDLYKQLAEKPGNVVVSPYSISSALAMTYAGARGTTADEMKKVLHFTLSSDKLHPAFGGVSDSFQTAGKNRPYELNIANALWSQHGLKLEPQFLDITGKSYGAGVRELDFGRSEAARATINRWVGERTKEKIPELLKLGDIDADVRLVLTNAVYFQGTWKEQFEKERTHDRDFEIAPGQRVRVPTMHRDKVKTRVSVTPDFHLHELPCGGDRWRMIFLLPAQRNGLREVEGKLTPRTLGDAIAGLKADEEDVAIPRFKLVQHSQLGDFLIKLGMPTAFSGDADFSGMTRQEDLHIARVIHEALIEVDEKGTVAAAATAVVMMRKSATTSSHPFVLDQPFLFILYDSLTDTILFLGRVSDPR